MKALLLLVLPWLSPANYIDNVGNLHFLYSELIIALLSVAPLCYISSATFGSVLYLFEDKGWIQHVIWLLESVAQKHHFEAKG
ncbi:hypothetical protein MC885_021398, partial [Smutsia gigantea]